MSFHYLNFKLPPTLDIIYLLALELVVCFTPLPPRSKVWIRSYTRSNCCCKWSDKLMNVLVQISQTIILPICIISCSSTAKAFVHGILQYDRTCDPSSIRNAIEQNEWNVEESEKDRKQWEPIHWSSIMDSCLIWKSSVRQIPSHNTREIGFTSNPKRRRTIINFPSLFAKKLACSLNLRSIFLEFTGIEGDYQK